MMPLIIRKPPFLLQQILPKSLSWQVITSGKAVFLTFDDGPTPGVTEKILDILRSYSAQATFFCVGENVAKNPGLYQRILEEGHAVGNHTFNHLNGWKTPTDIYLDNVIKCRNHIDSALFRPPYGRLTRSQIAALKKDYRIIMWSFLSMDYDRRVSKEKCLANVKKNLKPGSVIVFHDSLKAAETVKFVLSKFIEFIETEGYSTKPIEG